MLEGKKISAEMTLQPTDLQYERNLTMKAECFLTLSQINRTAMRRIKKVAVLGSGIMGSGIACHLANIGMDVLLLDIVPRDLSDSERDNPHARNRLVNDALTKAIKQKPAALYRKEYASRPAPLARFSGILQHLRYSHSPYGRGKV